MEKYCIDCKHYKKDQINVGYGWYESERCYRNAEFNLVNKKPSEISLKECHAEREDALRLEQFRCGKDGRYWEAK